MTLTDQKEKIIICKSAGVALQLRNKKLKTVPQAMEAIVAALAPYFKLHSIIMVRIILKSRITQHIYTLVRELLSLGIKIHSLKNCVKIPFTHVRGRIKRRR